MSREGKTSSAVFLNKLWKLVNDPVTDNLIKWAADGRSFIITDQTRFSQELVPKYFKHNNMASFIRQLNLYGFRKVVSIESGGLNVDKGEMEFSHPKFIQGQEILIEFIKRKPQGTRAIAPAGGITNLNDILLEVQALKANQEGMKEKMSEIKRENEVLCREYSAIRQKFSKQQHVIEKLVRFLISLVKNPGQHFGKWKFNHLAIEGGEHSMAKNASQNMSLQYEPSSLLPITGPVIREVTHLDEANPSISLNKIYQESPNTNPLTSRPKVLVNSYSQSTRSNDPVCKLEALESIVLAGNLAESYDSHVPDPVTVTHILSENNNDELAEFDPIQLVTDNKPDVYQRSSRAVTVQSPNGTFLPNDSPPLSPELLQTVDPSVVNPNIVVNAPNKAQTNFKYLIPSSSYKLPGEKNWSKIVKMENCGQLPNSMQNLEEMLPGENVRFAYESLCSDVGDSDRTSTKTYDVALKEKLYERDDILNHVDEVQLSLDYLKDMFTAGNLNLSVDKNTLLSLFGNEDNSLNIDSDAIFAGDSEVLGNEVSLYNPSLYDIGCGDTSDGLNFASLVSDEDDVSPRKKMRFDGAEMSKSEDEDITTPRPHQLPFDFKRS